MNFLKFLRTSVSSLPNTIADGSMYFVKATKALFLDIGQERHRINPPADWNETDTESPSYILNKPTIGTAATYDVAATITDTGKIPDTDMVTEAINIAKTQISNMVGTPAKASLKAEMINISKIYIYTGSEQNMEYGHWYYYNDVINQWQDGGTYNSTAVATDTTLTAQGMAADSKTVGDRLAAVNTNITTINADITDINSGITDINDDISDINDSITALNNRLQDLEYIPVKITSFTLLPAQAEIGSTVTNIICSYAFSKKPNTATISVNVDNETAHQNHVTLSQSSGDVTISDFSYTKDSTFTITGEDPGTENIQPLSITKTATLYFRNKIHYGVYIDNTIDDSFLLTKLQNHELAASRAKTITVNASTGQYIWYACPESFGTPTFTVGVLTGGFTKVSTFEHTNASGVKTNYQVWRSNQANLGNTTIDIK